MAIVYRYTDLADKIVKYIGIVYGKDRTLEQRIKEHSKEQKFQNYNWQIDYIEVDSRTDAEALEGHLIALHETYNHLNNSKTGWGVSKLLPNNFKWIYYATIYYKFTSIISKECVNPLKMRDIDILFSNIAANNVAPRKRKYAKREITRNLFIVAMLLEGFNVNKLAKIQRDDIFLGDENIKVFDKEISTKNRDIVYNFIQERDKEISLPSRRAIEKMLCKYSTSFTRAITPRQLNISKDIYSN